MTSSAPQGSPPSLLPAPTSRTPQQQQQPQPANAAQYILQGSPRSGSVSSPNNTPQHQMRRARTAAEKTHLAESSPIIVAPDDSVIDMDEDNAPLVIDTSNVAAGPVPVAPKPTQRPVTTKSAVTELMRLETQKKQTKDELDRIAECIKRCEGKLIVHMQKNDLIRIAAGEMSYLELRMKQKREKPRAKLILERLSQILSSGERNPNTIFKYIRAPVSVKTELALSKRQRRKANASKKGSKGATNAAPGGSRKDRASDVPPK